jgi:hypothetical protein
VSGRTQDCDWGRKGFRNEDVRLGGGKRVLNEFDKSRERQRLVAGVANSRHYKSFGKFSRKGVEERSRTIHSGQENQSDWRQRHPSIIAIELKPSAPKETRDSAGVPFPDIRPGLVTTSRHLGRKRDSERNQGVPGLDLGRSRHQLSSSTPEPTVQPHGSGLHRSSTEGDANNNSSGDAVLVGFGAARRIKL